MRNTRRSVGCQHLLLALAAHILVEATPVRWNAYWLLVWWGAPSLGGSKVGASDRRRTSWWRRPRCAQVLGYVYGYGLLVPSSKSAISHVEPALFPLMLQNVLMEAADSWNNWPTWAKRFLQL